MTLSAPVNLLLLQSARTGNYPQAVNALKRGAQVNITDAEGTTALMFAAQRGAIQIVDLLITAGADVNMHRRQFGTTALMFAAAANRSAIVTRLLAANADANATNEDGSTALMGATLADAREIVAMLIAAGADVRQIDTAGDNALNIAISNDRFQLVELLLAAGADVCYRRSDDGKTPLLLIPAAGDAKLLELLLAAGADPQAVDNAGESLLLIAAELGNSRLIQPLIRAGAQIDIQNHDGWTPLIAAVAAGQIAIVTALLDAGADPNLESRDRETALHLAAIVQQSGKSLAELVDSSFKTYPQILHNVRVDDRESRLNWEKCQPLQDGIAEAQSEMGDTGRVLVRASGTEPLIRVMVEAETMEVTQYWTGYLVAIVEKYF